VCVRATARLGVHAPGLVLPDIDYRPGHPGRGGFFWSYPMLAVMQLVLCLGQECQVVERAVPAAACFYANTNVAQIIAAEFEGWTLRSWRCVPRGIQAGGRVG